MQHSPHDYDVWIVMQHSPHDYDVWIVMYCSLMYSRQTDRQQTTLHNCPWPMGIVQVNFKVKVYTMIRHHVHPLIAYWKRIIVIVIFSLFPLPMQLILVNSTSMFFSLRSNSKLDINIKGQMMRDLLNMAMFHIIPIVVFSLYFYGSW